MADGFTHHQYWKGGMVLVPAHMLAAWALTHNAAVTVAIPVGYFMGQFLSPDLDLLGLSSSDGKMLRDLKIVGLALVLWFTIYAYLMRFVGIGRKGHRNFFSHFPGVGTAIRLAWLLAIPATAAVYYRVQIDPVLVQSILLGVFYGLAYADLIHYILDVVPNRRKRRTE